MRKWSIPVTVVVAATLLASLAPARATSTAGLASGAAIDCVGPAGDPEPGTQAWTDRDRGNQYCATERLQDQHANPAFGAAFWSQTPGIFGAQTLAQALEPAHPHASLGQLVPGGTTADPFRTIDRWTAAGRGRVTPVRFPASDGAQLNGFVFEPPATVPGPYPGIVITTGSIQGYQQMYFWAAEGLAEAGYAVLTYDVQGQGNSDTLPAQCTPSDCPGVPFQQSYNFFQGATDALDFFLSADNPRRADVDDTRIGIAGHSLGASAVSEDGQSDPRVKAIVAWDNLAPATSPLRTPALGINSEYFFNPTPMQSPPDPHAHDKAFTELAAAGIDTMQIALRASMHLEYSYVPYILPASRYGERVSLYYTLAWFDYHLRGSTDAFQRLVATSFDGSADASSIGGGTYDPAAALANPTDPTAGNVPTMIEGMSVPDRLSFYYRSGYALTAPDGTRTTCADLRAGCP
jgi:dienelactone hydrolase